MIANGICQDNRTGCLEYFRLVFIYIYIYFTDRRLPGTDRRIRERYSKLIRSCANGHFGCNDISGHPCCALRLCLHVSKVGLPSKQVLLYQPQFPKPYARKAEAGCIFSCFFWGKGGRHESAHPCSFLDV